MNNIYNIPPLPIEEHHKAMFPEHNRSRDAESEVLDGRNGAYQCSPHKFELSNHGAINANDCNNECNTGATRDLICNFNKFKNNKEEILLLELREKFHSWEQDILFQENMTQKGGLLQEKTSGL